MTYPEDLTTLYYWCDSYWLRKGISVVIVELSEANREIESLVTATGETYKRRIDAPHIQYRYDAAF